MTVVAPTLIEAATTRRSGPKDPGDAGPLRRQDWRALVGASICMFCGQSAVLLFTFGIFAPEIAAATGWSKVLVASAIAPGTIVAALLSPFVGLWGDRVGARAVALVGGPAYGLGLVALGSVSATPGQFMALMAIACTLGFAATPVLFAQLVTRWFHHRRGLALSIMFGSGSLGIAFWPPLAATLVRDHGWRTAYVVFGIAAGSLIFVAALLLIRNPPALANREAAALAPGMTAPAAFRTAVFWKIAFAFMLLTGALGGAAVNLPVILRQQGVSPQTAASVMAVAGGAMLVGRLSVGVFLDRWFAPRVTAAVTLLPIGAFAILLGDPGTIGVFAAAALLGLGLGSEFNAGAYLVGRAFGVRAFGSIYGAVTLGYGLASAAGPALVGSALASSVRPAAIFAVDLALLAAAIVLLSTIRVRDLPFGAKPAASARN